MNPAKVARCINNLPCPAHPERTGDWESRFDSAYISGELEIDVAGANGVPLKSLKAFIATELQKAREEGYRAGYEAAGRKCGAMFDDLLEQSDELESVVDSLSDSIDRLL